METVKEMEQSITDFVNDLRLGEDHCKRLKDIILTATMVCERAAVKSAMFAKTIPAFVESVTEDGQAGETLAAMVKDLVMAAALASYENVTTERTIS